MLGDTPYDVEAARGPASTASASLRRLERPGLAGAVAVYDGPRDLLLHVEVSPILRA